VSDLGPGELRRAALDALGPYADPRAREILGYAELVVAPGVVSWESSEGPVDGHRVAMAVDAECLGRLRAAPHLIDALHAALAAAIAGRPGEALAGLELCWDRTRARRALPGYRDAVPAPPAMLRDALVAYLEGRGEPELAAVAGRAATSLDRGSVHVIPAPGDRAALRAHGLADAIAGAVRDLVGEGPRVTVGA
jgi:hypothetical protein